MFEMYEDEFLDDAEDNGDEPGDNVYFSNNN